MHKFSQHCTKKTPAPTLNKKTRLYGTTTRCHLALFFNWLKRVAIFVNKYGASNILRKSVKISGHFEITYSLFYDLTPAISWFLIGQPLIFCSSTLPKCCNLPRKCTPVEYKVRQKAGFLIVSLSLPFSLFTATCASFVFLAAECFQFLDTVLHEVTYNFKRHKWSFVKYIVSFFGFKMVVSKLSLAKYQFLHKQPCLQ